MLPLRDYQRAAIDSLFHYWANDGGNPLLVVPTGGGKSLILAYLCKEILADWPDMRIVIVTHIKELLVQNHAELMGLWHWAPAGILSAGLRRKETHTQILFAGIQSAHSKVNRIGHVDLLLVDEAHLIPRNSGTMYGRFIADLRAINSDMRVVGLTATPYRLDSGRLDEGDDRLFDAIAYEVPVRQLLEEGYLSPPISKATATTFDVSGVGTRGGEYIPGELQKAVNKEAVTRAAIDEIMAYGANRRAWLLFCAGVEHAYAVRDELRRRGVSAEALDGSLTSRERDRIVEGFRAGQFRALTNVSITTTGFNVPQIDLLAMLRPTKSPGLYLQMCLDAETEILGREGWKRIGEISIGDEVAGFDLATEEVRWQSVEAVVDRPLTNDEKMLGVSSPHLDFRITDDHEMVVTSRKAGGGAHRWRKESATKATKRQDAILLPIAGTLRASGLPLTDAEIAFLGWFLSDGSLHRRNNNISIAQSVESIQNEHIKSTLDACGFRYGYSLIRRNNGYADLNCYRISHGDARIDNGTGSLGWSRLAAWINADKEITAAYDDISREQLIVLLDALWRGDGSKLRTATWTVHTKTVTCGTNRKMTDRLQALCVTRGIRCNISFYGQNNWILHYRTDKNRAMIRGARKDDDNKNAKLIDRHSTPGERVWCVTTPMGTIITRRNGKVVITGNCGRGLRLSPGKADCLVLDFAKNVWTHGPIDAVKPPRKPGKGDGEPPVKECPGCHSLVPLATMTCPDCGHVFVAEDVAKHEAKAANVPILSMAEPTWVNVTGRVFRRHEKPGSPATMMVEYACGLAFHRAWICFEHEGYARTRAAKFWMDCGGRAPIPVDVDEALSRTHELLDVDQIRIRANGKYWEILGQKTTTRRMQEAAE